MLPQNNYHHWLTLVFQDMILFWLRCIGTQVDMSGSRNFWRAQEHNAPRNSTPHPFPWNRGSWALLLTWVYCNGAFNKQTKLIIFFFNLEVNFLYLCEYNKNQISFIVLVIWFWKEVPLVEALEVDLQWFMRKREKVIVSPTTHHFLANYKKEHGSVLVINLYRKFVQCKTT